MPADIRQNVAPLRRVRMQRPMRARMRFLLAPALDELGRPLLSLARGNARVIRRLGRTIQLRPQPGDLGPKGGDRLRLPFDRLRLRQGDAINSSRSSESNVVARFILTVNQRMIPESIPPTDIDERGEQLRLARRRFESSRPIRRLRHDRRGGPHSAGLCGRGYWRPPGMGLLK